MLFLHVFMAHGHRPFTEMRRLLARTIPYLIVGILMGIFMLAVMLCVFTPAFIIAQFALQLVKI